MEHLQTGQRVTGTIDGYTSEGHGVLRAEGAVVFVPGGVREDRLDVKIINVGKRAAWGEIVRILDASPWRRGPDCPWFGQCGGCAFRHAAYEEELRAKRQRVQDALRRIGGADVEVEEILGAAHPLGYRNKSQFPVSPDGTVGFYCAGSHQVVPVRDCRIQTDAANRTAAAVQGWMKRYGVPGYDERTGRGLVRHVYVRTNSAGESLCCVVANGRTLPREPELAGRVREAVPGTAGVLLNVNRKPGNVVLGEQYRTIWGRDFLTETLRGLTFRLSVPSFFQVNREQAEVLYGKALEYAGLSGTETALDLYCGVGTITLCLAQQAARAVGAEIVPQAVEDARDNAVRNSIHNAEFLCANAWAAAERLGASGLKPDVITVDPPRKGLSPDTIRAVAAMGPERVVYVSCDPGTLGRDVGRFREAGYRAVRAAAVDLFPGTRHVESVVLLSQQKPDDHIVVDLDLDELDTTATEAKATYAEIKAFVWQHHGLKVSSLYISQVKRKCGLEVGHNYNVSKSDNPKVPMCPPEKEEAIMEALRWFRMISL